MEDNIIIVDEQGNEIEMTVLFTFCNEETQTNYVFYYDDAQEEIEVFVHIYDELGNLIEITNDEEWDFVNEVYNSFVSQEGDEV